MDGVAHHNDITVRFTLFRLDRLPFQMNSFQSKFRNSEIFLERLRTSPQHYKAAVINRRGEDVGSIFKKTKTTPVDPRLERLQDAKVLLMESIFLWEYFDFTRDNIYGDLDETVRIADMCGTDLLELLQPQRTLEEGCFWSDSDYCMDKFADTELGTRATAMLCEANIAGIVLPEKIAAFMKRLDMVHLDDCEEQLDDGDPCFTDDDSLDVDDVCQLAGLLRDWDVTCATMIA